MASVCAVTADRRIVNIWAAVLLMVKIQAPVALDYLEVGSLLEGHDLVGLDDAKETLRKETSWSPVLYEV